jgi:aspartate racemase
MKTIGILGGLGPIASAQLYLEILKLCQKEHQAVQDCDYPKIIIVSLPLPDFDEHGSTDSPQTQALVEAALKTLEAAGADFIAMACNTIHLLYPQLVKAVKIPIINLIEETVNYFQNFAYQKIGIICSAETSKSGLYAQAFHKRQQKLITTNQEDQKAVTKAIAAVMGGTINDVTRHELTKVVHSLENAGAEVLLVGCTELPLALNHQDIRIPVIDATRILAMAAVSRAYATSDSDR